MMREFLPYGLSFAFLGFLAVFARGGNVGLDDPYGVEYVVAQTDTLPPIQERYDTDLTDQGKNPFDLQDPNVIKKDVEYDPVTGNYIITERIGDDYFRPPTYMTFEEYLEWKKKNEERAYFNQLAGVSSGKEGMSALDPIAKFDVENSLIDRLFGGNTVDIRPQGGIDLTFGVDHSKTENPILIQRQSRQTVFDFDMDINMNVTGKIGEKLNLNTNYNTNATFDFDNQIKLDYNSDAFGEDDILKKIEAGNVSLPLRGTLIQGAQSLFGLKTELQFGHLRLTAIASQQKSQRENIQIEGGAQLQEFEVRADEYDENRHFFLSHYNRDVFEFSLQNLPQIKGLFKLENIEVWITNDRNEVEDVRDIVAFADLGEPRRLVNPENIDTFPTPRYREICEGKPLPDNEANDLYNRLIDRADNIREIDQTVSILQSGEFGMIQSRDFEKVSARKLRSTEYTVHPQLGFISVNINVQPDQVLGIAFQYSYNGQAFKVGELSVNTDNVGTDTTDLTPRVLFVKMLKSTTQRIDLPTWDLMMKNVYPIGAFQVSQEDFRLDVFYDDPGRGQKRFLPESNLEGVPLLRVFNLDNLNVQGDPQPDGVFDYVPGITINPRNGRIMFPVLEPFGSSLRRQIDDPRLKEKFTYQELYDQTLFQAQEFPEKNRYVIKGSYKSSISSEISLGAFNIPEGSVTVSAGGQQLREGVDYEIDYNLGRVRILNDALLNAGVPINVSYEDNTLFGFQSKTMLGLRADYEVDDNFNIGATYLQLFERPFTQKVNIGEDPINNKMYGLDLNFSREAPWLTKIVDGIPGIQTKAPSTISVAAEAAALKPGHSRAINQNRKDKGGIVYIDDFEGSANGTPLGTQVKEWTLASVPQNDGQNNNPLFPEANQINSWISGANRAKLSWYRIFPSSRGGRDGNNPYTSIVQQEEVFPNLRQRQDQRFNFQTFDMAYYPEERGPYNFDLPNGGYPGFTEGVRFEGDSLKLAAPETRWAGIMRDLNINDFQSANIEFLEFWMLSPYLDPENAQAPSPDRADQEGTLYINLGNISEDILRDSRKFFENGLPSPTNPERKTDETVWSRVPIAQQITNAFDNGEGTREAQDLGLDGLDNAGEREKFSEYLQQMSVNTQVLPKLQRDPANDDFRHFTHPSFSAENTASFRYRDFNNPQGNSREPQRNSNQRTSSQNEPDSEDLNQDNTLNETESYFQYAIPLRYNKTGDQREIDQEATPFITDRRVAENGRIWYRFRVPLRGPDKISVGGIRDFRSIRFMRMYLKGFEKPIILRFAQLELVRNQWRRYNQDLSDVGVGIDECEVEPVLDIDNVNIEENSEREPFNYVLPEGIQRERTVGVFSALQNEQSLSLKVSGLCDGEDKAVFKNLDFDFRVYERMKMFVHAEAVDDMVIPDGGLSLFIRLGSDFRNNYYEYEIPLVMSSPDSMFSPLSKAYKLEVWRLENEVDVALEDFITAKKARNKADFSLNDEFVFNRDNGRVIKVRGNPNIGFVKVMMMGVRNPQNFDGATYSAEVWLNELRLTGLDERGGVAALARVDAQLADFGSLTLAGNYSSIGFGQIDQKVQERAREQVQGYDIAANLELGKFFPENWGLRLPFYAQYSHSVSNPEFDPYDLDIKLKDKIADAETAAERDSIKELAQDVVKIKTYNFTNVRKERTNASAKPMPWDIENFSASYSYTETDRRDPIIESDNEKKYTGGIDYAFSRRVTYIEPFKSIKSDTWLRILKEFNFNPLPNSFSFSTILDRRFARTTYRFTDLAPRFSTFYNKRFTWDRDYNLNWDFSKSLKINFNALAASVIDEPDELAMQENPNITDIRRFRRDSIWNNIKDLGRIKNYRHNLTVNYTLPVRYLPFMDWTQVRAQYQSDYTWSAAALNTDSLGNVIQNSQYREVRANLDFDRLYNSISFLKEINRSSNARSRGRSNTRRSNTPGRSNQGQDQGGDKKNTDGPAPIVKALVRPLLLLRKAEASYSERFRTVIPGYMPQSSLLGMSPGFGSPGWDFIAGLQPKIRTLDPSDYNVAGKDWLYDNRSWITNNVFLNQEVIQEYTQDFRGNITLEPFNDFEIELEAKRSFTENHSQYFKDTLKNNTAEYFHAIPKNLGSMTVSFFSLNTLFEDSRQQIIDLFREFEGNRAIISQRIGEGVHEDENLANDGYTFGYGKTQQNVLIPAFLATYTGEDPRSIKLDIFDVAPKVNWRVNYNGLSNIPFLSDLFDNVTIGHSYSSTLTVNAFNTGLDFLRTQDPFLDPRLRGFDFESGNYYAEIEIPEVAIQESFSPLVSFDATLTNGMSFNMEYKKARTLAMNFGSKRLNETQTKEIVIGFGYLMRNVEFGFLKGKRSKNKKRDDQQDQPQNPNVPNRGRNSQRQGQDLDLSFDFSLRDDVTFTHILDQGIVEPTRGSYILSLSPAAEYQLNQRLALRLFFDYRRNVPKTSAGFPRTNAAGGVVVRFSLH